jgi:hypothetical protein
MPHVSGNGGDGGNNVGGGGGGSGSSSSGGGGSGGGGGAGAGTSGGGAARMRDDPGDCDEVKVFKCAEDEGEGDSDDVINEDKRDLIRATEADQVNQTSFLFFCPGA